MLKTKTKKILALTIVVLGFSTISINYSYADIKTDVKNIINKIKGTTGIPNGVSSPRGNFGDLIDNLFNTNGEIKNIFIKALASLGPTDNNYLLKWNNSNGTFEGAFKIDGDGNLNLSNKRITNVGDPIDDNDVVTKKFFQDNGVGFWMKDGATTNIKNKNSGSTVKITDDLEVGGDETVSGNLDVNTNIEFGTTGNEIRSSYSNGNNSAILYAKNSGKKIEFRANSNTYNQVVLDTNGNVGIGTANPGEKIDVRGSIKHTGTMIASGPNYYSTWMKFKEHQWGNSLILGAGGLTAIGAGESATQVSNNVLPSTEILYLASDNGVQFTTNLQNGWSNKVDAMSISSNGNVGIGTTNPSTKLDVRGNIKKISGTNDIVELGTTGSEPRIRLTDNTDSVDIVGNGPNFGIKTDSQYRLYIKKDGNIGIGTTNPSKKLHISAQNTTNLLRLERTGTAAGYTDFDVAGDYLRIGTKNYSNVLNIDTGKVGIGTNAPSKKLDVAGDINFSGNLYKNGTQVDFAGQWSKSGNNISNKNSGNVGIGTNNPSQKLDVNGDIRTKNILANGTYGSVKVGNSNYGTLEIIGNSSRGSYLSLHEPGTKTFHIGLDDHSQIFNIREDGINSNSFFRIDGNSNQVSFPYGNVGIGTNNPSAKLDVAGTAEINGTLNMTNHHVDNVSKLSFNRGDNYRIETNSSGLLFDGGDGAWDFLVYDERAYLDNLVMGYNGGATLTTYNSNENLIIDPNGNGTVSIATSAGGNFKNGKGIALGDSDTGIRQDGDGQLELWTNNGERVHIDSTNTTVKNNLIVSGNLTVNGTETKINSTNMYVKDRNIYLNNGGDNTSSDTAGIEIEDGNSNGNNSSITWNRSGKYFQIKDGTGTHRITTENIDKNTWRGISDSVSSTSSSVSASSKAVKTAYDLANSKQNRVTGTCAAGSSIRVINSNGTVTCETDDDTDTVLTESTVETYVANDVSTNYIPKDNGNKFTNSAIYDNGGNIGIGTTSPGEKLTVAGGDIDVRADTPRIRVTDTGESNKYIELRYEGGRGRLYTDGSNIYTNRMFRADGGLRVSNDEGFYRSAEDQISTLDDSLIVDRDLYIGENGQGTTDQYFYDDNSNTWRGIRWNDGANRFELEENNGSYYKILRAGDSGDYIADNTIDSSEIQNNSLTYNDIADGTIRNQELANNSVNSAKVADGSLKYQDTDTNSIQRRITGSCAAGSSIRVINSNGTVVCETDDSGGGGSSLWSENGSKIYYNTNNVGIGTNNPSYKLDVNGTLRASAFYYSSDKRLKKNIKTIDSALEKINKLRGVEFIWKKTERKDVGLIAQEVEKVFPKLVKTDENGYKSIEYANLVSPIIEAIKELSKKVDIILKQQEKIKILENKVNNLEQRLEKLEKLIK